MRILFAVLIILLAACFGNKTWAQTKVLVKGVVIDKTTKAGKADVTISAGKPLQPIGTTDAKGAFTVSVAVGTELVFSHIGYGTAKSTITGATSTFGITLEEKEDPMVSVVVQGFKRKTRETATGASTIVSGKSLQDVPVSNVVELLQGKVAGLNIQNNNGSPGGMGTINLRGLSSIAISGDGFLTPTSPLFIIDGIPVDANSNYEYGFQGGGPGISPLSLIPPEDIDQVEVLKDAAATSQYGSRAAYGVILITTRRGQSKVPIVQYSGNFFVNTVPKLREIYGGKDERLTRIRAILDYDTTLAAAMALINNTPFLSDSLNPFYNNATDWQKYFYRTTYNQQHNISILGGDSKFNYKTNLNYYQQNGIVENTGFKRYSLSMNALYQPVDAFRMVVSLTTSLAQKQNGSGVGVVQTGLAQSANTSSLLPPPSLFSENNSTLAAASVRDNNKTANIATSLDLQYEPIKGLRFANLLSYNYISGTADKFTPSFLQNGSSQTYSYNDRTFTLYNRSTINYIKTFDDAHNFNLQVFNEINTYGFRANAVHLIQTGSDQIEGPIGYNWNASGGGTLDNIKDTRIHGYGGAFSYNFNKKYVIDLNYRLDGTSTNGPTSGYTENPSISARWNFGKEGFLHNAKWLSYGSLRGSWGKNIRPTGNIFDVYGKYISGSQYNNTPTVTIDYANIPNNNFLPEVQTQSNIGLEFGLWDNAVQVVAETYYRSIDNQLISVDLANINGFQKLQANAVSLVNYGVELNLILRVTKQTNPFKWTLSFTGAYNRDILAKLPNDLRQLTKEITDNNQSVPVVYRLGRNALSNLVYHTRGVYNSTADVPVNIGTGLRQQLGAGTGFYFQGGDPRWTDVNGDYVIDGNDLLPLGNPVPRFTGGLLSNMTYKNFQLSCNFSYTMVRDLLNTSQAQLFQNYTAPTAINALLPIANYNFWQASANDKTSGTINAQYPNPYDFRRAGALQPYRTNQSLFMEDGSYVKINNLVLIYNLGKNIISRLGMTSCRVSLTANNVYTFSNYTGPDPELVTALGRDNSGGYPNARSYAVGLNIQF